VRCGFCATLYHADEPDWEHLAQIYQDDYHQKRGHSGDETIETSKQLTMLANLRILKQFNPPGPKLLDVGCSTGAGLESAARNGWDVTGVEFSKPAAELARQRPGVKAVHDGPLQDTPIAEESFDVITLFDVIEHIDTPRDTLSHIYRLLRPGGLLMMVTPDGASISTRLMKSRSPHLFVEHVVLFSRKGMRFALQSAGFQVLRIRFALKRINLNMMVRHATIHKHLSFGRIVRTLGRILPGFLLNQMIPLNIGEFYVIAHRPA
jgi:2-polyprenyl-3-methyl-5-hydroxy-6-metoxy-1,4-benzoquinol methylase